MAGGNAYNKGVKEAQQKGQQEQEKQDQQAQQQQAQSKNTPAPTSRGFDSAGNRITDSGKIVQFAGQSARDQYLSERGVGNTGQITNQELFGKSDFSAIGGTNYSSPTSKPSEVNIFTDKTISEGNKSSVEQFFRGSTKEDQIKQSEAERASKIYTSSSNSYYLTGGKPEGSNVIWIAPSGNQYRNMGQGINNSLVRNSPQEAKAKASEASKASSLFYPQQKEYGNNKVFTVGGPKYPVKQNSPVVSKESGKSYGTDWINAQLGTKQNYRGNTPAQQKTITELGKQKTVETPISTTTPNNNSVELANGLISLSNKQITEKNNQVGLGNALISLSNKQIAQKNLKSESETKSYLHQGEKEYATFTFYAGNKEVGQTSGRRSYYDLLSAQKKYGNVSVGKSYPEREKELSGAVAKNPDFYTNLSPAYWKGLSEAGYYTEKNAPKINSQIQTHWTAKNLGLLQGTLYSERHGGEVPSASGPIYIPPPEHEVASFVKTPFAGQKVSTSNIPSTSWVNVAQLYPGLPIADRLGGPASEIWVNLLSKAGTRLAGFKNEAGIRFNNKIQERAMENQYNFPKPYEPIRPTNLKELEPVGLQISKQTMGKRPQTALEKALSESPRVKENPNYKPSTNIWNPKPQSRFDINKPTETSIYHSSEKTSNLPSPKEKAMQERYPLFSLKSLKIIEPISNAPRSAPTSSSKSLLTNKGPLPFLRESGTRTSSETSPISREFLGVQSKGQYPTSYLPSASGFASSKTTKPIVVLPERGDYQDFRFRQFMDSAYTKGKFGFTITPKEEPTSPEFLNILGRKGKPPIKTSYPKENIITRSEYVGKRAFTAEDFLTSSGKKGSVTSPSFSVVGKKVTSKKTETPTVMFNTGNKMPSPLQTGESNYQLWRNKQYQLKNPEPIKIGDERFLKDVITKLPKQNKKAPVFSVNLKEGKSMVGFRRASKSLFEQKPKEEKPKEITFKNTGSSKQQSVLLQKPLVRRKLVSSQEQQYDYGYEFKPVPATKTESGYASGLISGIKLGSLIGIKGKQGSKSLYESLNKTLEMTRAKTGQNQSPKQGQRFFQSTQQIRASKQIPSLFSSSKQSQKPKQIQKQISISPTPQKSKQTFAPKFASPQKYQQTTQPPKPKVLPTPPLFGKLPNNRKGKGKNGPTGLYNLNVNNIFSSSLNINFKKGQRYEF